MSNPLVCLQHVTTATLGINKGDGREEHTFVCDGEESLKRKTIGWVYNSLKEGAEEYHAAAHLRDADLINPAVLKLEPPSRRQ